MRISQARALFSLRRRNPRRTKALAAIAVLAAGIPVMVNQATGDVGAALPTTFAASTQFDLTGFLQSATLDPTCVATAGASLDAQGNPQVAHCGGTLTVNGQLVTVPNEMVVILPASALTWQELFAQSPAPYTGSATGMAMNDSPTPHTTYEFNVIGNRVVSGGQDRYIAGLVHVSQQDLNAGAGYINYINYTDGSFEVGGRPGIPGTGSVVRINDPYVDANDNGVQDPGESGRYGRAFSPDGRFMVDQDNPTILSATGYPMCIPRVAADPNIPGNADDPLCPLSNRPISVGGPDPITGQQHPPAGQFDSFFTTKAPGLGSPDPRFQSPMEIGDYVNTAGTLIQGAGGADYISAHTVVNNTAIYTLPGVDPAYVSIEVALVGTGGLTVFGAGEAAARTRIEGMTTDPSRNVRLYGIDINPATGATTDRDWGSVGVDPGPPNGAVKGRWRFRPPCPAGNTVATDKRCVGPAAGNFLPPTRELRAVVEGHQQFLANGSINPASQVPGTPSAVTAANGIFYDQYHAPIGEYIFPENVPGQPIPENNFGALDFLAYGGYQSFTGVKAGVLNPWPSNVPAPVKVCATPTIIGGPYSVANGGSIVLSGAVNADASTPLQLSWTAGTLAGGTDLNGALTNATTSTPTFNATGLAAGTYNLTFTTFNICGIASATTTIVVQNAPKPTINPIPSQTVGLGTPAASPVVMTATSASLPAPTFVWAKTGGPAVGATSQVPTAATQTASSSFTFVPTIAGTYTYAVTATNANGSSNPIAVTIIVTATTTTNIVITPAEYRIGKQRLVLTATTPDLAVTSMVLQPYRLDNGTTFNPASLGASFTNGGGGVWTLTIVGAPPPACRNNPAQYVTPCTQTPLLVTSTSPAGNGSSPQTALDRIRA